MLSRSAAALRSRLAAGAAFFVLMFLAADTSLAAQVSLAWDANTETNLAGYRVHIGQASRAYDTVIDVGKVTSYTVSGLLDGRVYYFAVTAYDTAGAQSVFSEEVTAMPADATPPAISGVSASPTRTGATISWLTNEASDSQVEYGATTSYGTLSPVNGSPVMSHTVTISGLAPTSLYHYRVRSRDASGNLAISGDFAFTTTGDTAPTVSITAPASGATVAGTVTVSASAADDAGVAGVQFTLDGANLGSEDTAAPYAVSWATTGASNGTHTLAAVARDSAGNIATSAPVTVTVSNDATAPIISSVTATGVAASKATISWTTNEAADSQVEYGLTTAYGSATTVDGARVTSHAIALGGLSGGTLYHYRVLSRDASGNLRVSGDFTFTTRGATASALPGTGTGFGFDATLEPAHSAGGTPAQTLVDDRTELEDRHVS
jgi:hypothetical protein